MAILYEDGLVVIVNHLGYKVDRSDYLRQFEILLIGSVQKSRDAVNALYHCLTKDGRGAWSCATYMRDGFSNFGRAW